MKRHVPPLLVALIGFVFLIHAQLTPRYVRYDIGELNLYVRALDSLRAENTRKDSIIVITSGNLRVSEYNHGRAMAQLDVFIK